MIEQIREMVKMFRKINGAECMNPMIINIEYLLSEIDRLKAENELLKNIIGDITAREVTTTSNSLILEGESK